MTRIAIRRVKDVVSRYDLYPFLCDFIVLYRKFINKQCTCSHIGVSNSFEMETGVKTGVKQYYSIDTFCYVACSASWNTIILL